MRDILSVRSRPFCIDRSALNDSDSVLFEAWERVLVLTSQSSLRPST